MKDESSSDQRLLGALQISVSEVKDDVLQLRQEMRSNVGDLKAGMDNLAKSLSESQRAPWATLAGWAGVLVAFGGLVAGGLTAVGGIAGTSMWRAIDGNAMNIKELQVNRTDDKVKLETTKGTAETAARAAIDLDTRLQREMSDKDETLRTLIEERTGALEARIENQIAEQQAAVARIRDEQFSRAFDRISKLERWMDTQLGISPRVPINGVNNN